MAGAAYLDASNWGAFPVHLDPPISPLPQKAAEGALRLEASKGTLHQEAGTGKVGLEAPPGTLRQESEVVTGVVDLEAAPPGTLRQVSEVVTGVVDLEAPTGTLHREAVTGAAPP